MKPVEITRFLGTHHATDAEYAAAAEAVKIEHRANSRTMKLRCLRVAPAGEEHEGIYALDVSRFGELDWTWEGARAFRSVASAGADDVGAPYSWSGEIVEVDEVESRVFVKTGSGEHRPCIGEFLVNPYEFLAALHALFNGEYAASVRQSLIQGLAGAAGEPVPAEQNAAATLPDLAHMWRRSWGYLWGPPGTGKTFTVGQQVAAALADPTERILVVSTTNKATDEAALSIGRALRDRGARLAPELACRVGSGADIERFRSDGLEQLLAGGEAWLRHQLSALLREHEKERGPARRAQLWVQIQAMREALSTGRVSVADVDSQVVIATAFVGVRDLANADSAARIARNASTFTTVIVDEAGLVPRVACAALSFWAARRFVLVGDPKQLSPISKISRVLSSSQAQWVASSGLAHVKTETEGMHLLAAQHRMHPHIRRVVSEYQYEGRLVDGPSVASRATPLDAELTQGCRAIWYVVDEDADEIAHIRAERGPGNKSWIRQRSPEIVDRLLRAHPALAHTECLFITPFVAQARALSKHLGERKLTTWRASTIHRQQGVEADCVIFDTVNASSTAWAHDEWQRLINVGMSRARHFLIVLASRLEMQEPYMGRLAGLLTPRVLRGVGGQLKWREVPVVPPEHTLSERIRKHTPSALGTQLETRKAMRPILSAEQQRLCAYPLDGKPRLVRGVAGSGKTAVLAHWLARRAADPDAEGPFWVLYANAALHGLLQETIGSAWSGLGRSDPFPWHEVKLFHLLDLLEFLETEAGVPVRKRGDDAYEFDSRASVLLQEPLSPRCKALFIDEAQDYGADTLSLLTKLVEPTNLAEPQGRSINIFYDNAQNVYGRSTPRWSQLGLDMRGRSTVMKESFRSTQPITEFALNVLYRLQPPDGDPDHAELIARDLIDQEQRNGRRWWRVRFNQVHGPAPEFRRFPERDAELSALSAQVEKWITREGVRPGDIRIIAQGQKLRERITKEMGRVLAAAGARVEEQARQRFSNADDAVVVTTAHSFKGYEGEVVAVPAADKFVVAHRRRGSPVTTILPSVLYVAMTRARSILYVSSIDRSQGSPSALVVDALQTSLEDLRSLPTETLVCTPVEEDLELLERIGTEHRDWLRDVMTGFEIKTGPLCRSDGSIIAEPLFWFRSTPSGYACFDEEPSAYVVQELQDIGFRPLRPGVASGSRLAESAVVGL
jgi:hypothetical protein